MANSKRTELQIQDDSRRSNEDRLSRDGLWEKGDFIVALKVTPPKSKIFTCLYFSA